MPVGLTCPNCGAAISEASVVAAAPVCTHCRVVITSVGGTLGFTSAYGLGDPTITRRRVEADLAVLRDAQMKYRGMLEACKQQLDWSVERYAQLPEPPELLKLEDVPSFWLESLKGLGAAIAWLVGSFIAAAAFWLAWSIYETIKFLPMGSPDPLEKPFNVISPLIIFGGSLGCALSGPFKHIKAEMANGNRPYENARRQKAYDEAVAAALRAAEPLKAAEDHRLRCQIRDLEGSAKMVSEMEADVRRILANG